MARATLSDRRVVIFDFDGTIADTSASIISTATTVLTEWGVDPKSLNRVGELIGPPFPQAFEMVFGLSHDAAVEVTERYRRIYTHLGAEAWPAFPGMVDLLEELKEAGKILGVASSKRTPLVRMGLDDNGITELFDSLQAKEDDESTTKVDAIRNVLEDVQYGTADAVMVGDRFHDVEAAKACGVPCVGVLYGHTAERSELEDAGAASIATSVDELREILLG